MKPVAFLKTQRHRITVFLLSLFTVTGFTIGNAAAQDTSLVPKQGLLWKVTGKDITKPSYLFGTFHILDSSYIAPLTKVNEAFRQSEAVVGEIIIDGSLGLGLISSLVMDSSIKDMMKPEDYELLSKQVEESIGLDMTFLNNIKPLGLYFLLQAGKLKDSQEEILPSPGGGSIMDLHFQAEGKRRGKKILGLETAEDQVHALFDATPLDKQIEILVEALRDTTTGAPEFDSLSNCYDREDLHCLRSLGDANDFEKFSMKALLEDRNTAWLERLPAILRKQSSFVAVGALHLTGNDGLVAGLRKKGYTVTRVPLK